MRAAGAAIGNYRLVDAELFVTVEPCAMCVGAIIQARLRGSSSAAPIRKQARSAARSTSPSTRALNHRFAVRGGVCESEARELLQRFFRSRRGETATRRDASLSPATTPVIHSPRCGEVREPG